MNLQELQNQYQALVARDESEKAAAGAREEQEKQARLNHIESQARAIIAEALGELAEDLKPEMTAYDDYRRRMVFKTAVYGLYIHADYEPAHDRVSVRLTTNHSADFILPAKDSEPLTRYIGAAIKQAELKRESTVEDLINRLQNWRWDDEDWGQPNTLIESFNETWGRSQRVEAALQESLGQYAAKLAQIKAREAHAEDVQSKAWADFKVYRVAYARMDDESGSWVETAFVLHPQPDNFDGWYTSITWGGKLIRSKFAHVVRVDELVVDGWKNEHANHVCRRLTHEGVTVLCPPEGAEI